MEVASRANRSIGLSWSGLSWSIYHGRSIISHSVLYVFQNSKPRSFLSLGISIHFLVALFSKPPQEHPSHGPMVPLYKRNDFSGDGGAVLGGLFGPDVVAEGILHVHETCVAALGHTVDGLEVRIR